MEPSEGGRLVVDCAEKRRKRLGWVPRHCVFIAPVEGGRVLVVHVCGCHPPDSNATFYPVYLPCGGGGNAVMKTLWR